MANGGIINKIKLVDKTYNLQDAEALHVGTTVTIPQGGTGATTAAVARANLEITPVNIGAYGDYLGSSITDVNDKDLIGYAFVQKKNCANLPDAEDANTFIFVIFSKNIQMAIPYNSNGSPRMYIRFNTNSNTWYPWRAIGDIGVDNIIPIESGGTGASSAAAARINLGITAENLNALPLTGGTLTGNLNIKRNATQASLWFYNKDSETVAGGISKTIDSNGDNRIVFSVRNEESEANEVYYLPPSDIITTAKGYNILTTKNPVTIAQGGTGATTASQALQNLDAFGASSSKVSTDADIFTYGASFLNADDVANLPNNSSIDSKYFLTTFMGNLQRAEVFGDVGVRKVYERYYSNSKWYPWVRTGVRNAARFIQIDQASKSTIYNEFHYMDIGETAIIEWSADPDVSKILTVNNMTAQSFEGIIYKISEGDYDFFGNFGAGNRIGAWRITGLTSSGFNLALIGDFHLYVPLINGVIPVSVGGTGATSASEARTNLNITPANIGALALDGTNTMSGNLKIKVDNPHISLYKSDQASYVASFYSTADANGGNKLSVAIRKDGSQAEIYSLPIPDAHTGSVDYQILTSKKLNITDVNDTVLYTFGYYGGASVSNLPNNTSTFGLLGLGPIQIAYPYGASASDVNGNIHDQGPRHLYIRSYINNRWYPWSTFDAVSYIRLVGENITADGIMEQLQTLTMGEVANIYIDAYSCKILTSQKVNISGYGTVMRGSSFQNGNFYFDIVTNSGSQRFAWTVDNLSNGKTFSVGNVYNYTGTVV